MTMIIEGPFPGISQAIILPNPTHGNTEGRDQTVDLHKSINGTRRTYVKSSSQRRLEFSWDSLGRGKLVELQEFHKFFAGEHVKLTDFRGDVWDVIFIDQPNLTVQSRSINSGAARKESGNVTLEFLGVQIA